MKGKSSIHSTRNTNQYSWLSLTYPIQNDVLTISEKLNEYISIANNLIGDIWKYYDVTNVINGENNKNNVATTGIDWLDILHQQYALLCQQYTFALDAYQEMYGDSIWYCENDDENERRGTELWTVIS